MAAERRANAAQMASRSVDSTASYLTPRRRAAALAICRRTLVVSSCSRPQQDQISGVWVVAIVVHLAHTHTLAAIIPCMECVGSGNTNVKCGRKGWNNCGGENVSRA